MEASKVRNASLTAVAWSLIIMGSLSAVAIVVYWCQSNQLRPSLMALALPVGIGLLRRIKVARWSAIVLSFVTAIMSNVCRPPCHATRSPLTEANGI